MWSWLWQLLGLLLLIALLLIAINWIVRRAIRNVPADATFELIEARTTVAERNLSEVIHRSETRVIEAGRAAMLQWGSSTTGARISNGSRAYHIALEEKLAAFLNREASLVSAAGYISCMSSVAAFAQKGDVVRPKKIGVLSQDQYAFDAYRVIDTVFSIYSIN